MVGCKEYPQLQHSLHRTGEYHHYGQISPLMTIKKEIKSLAKIVAARTL